MHDIMADVMKNGEGIVAVCLELGISRETLNQWTSPKGDYYNKPFSDAYAHARLLYQKWWETQGRLGMNKGKIFNGNVWDMAMRNQFRDDWNPVNKTEHSGSIASPVIIDDINEED
jgi:hypothetical protein